LIAILSISPLNTYNNTLHIFHPKPSMESARSIYANDLLSKYLAGIKMARGFVVEHLDETSLNSMYEICERLQDHINQLSPDLIISISQSIRLVKPPTWETLAFGCGCEVYLLQTLQDNPLFPLRKQSISEEGFERNLDIQPIESESRNDLMAIFMEGMDLMNKDIQSFSISQSYLLSLVHLRGKVAAKALLTQLILSSSDGEGFDLDSFISILRKIPSYEIVVSYSNSNN
jgi:hypothetical protein